MRAWTASADLGIRSWPGRRIAGEGDARRRRFAHVAKNHGLNSDRGAKSRRNIVQPPVGDRARIHPGLEHGADGAPELFARILRKRLAQGSFDPCREIDDQLPPILGRKLRIESYAFVFFIILQDLFEYVMFDAQHQLAYIWRQMPVAHQPPATIIGQLVGMGAEPAATSASTACPNIGKR
jgi:hypothetical protein